MLEIQNGKSVCWKNVQRPSTFRRFLRCSILILVLMLTQVRAFAALTPEERVTLMQTGMSRIAEGKPLEAITPFEQLLTAQPNDPMASYYCAVVMGVLGEINASIYFYNQAVKGGYAGEPTHPDVVGQNLKQYQAREFAVDITSLDGRRRTVTIKGNTGADDTLAADALSQVDKMKEVYGLSDFREVYANFIAWSGDDSFYERWRFPSADRSVYLWVTFKTNLPPGSPSKTIIEIADSDIRAIPSQLGNLLALVPSGKAFTPVSAKEADAARAAMTGPAARAQAPEHPDLRKAEQLVASGDCSSALPLLENIVRDLPAFPDGYWGRAYCQAQLKNYQAAIKDYYKILEIDPQAADAYQSMAVAYMALKNEMQAETALWHYLKLRPNDGNAWYSYAAMTMNRDDLERAKQLGVQDTLGLQQILDDRDRLRQQERDWGRPNLLGWVILASIVVVIWVIVAGLKKTSLAPAFEGSFEERAELKRALDFIDRLPDPGMNRFQLDSNIYAGWCMAGLFGLFAFLTLPIAELFMDGPSKGAGYAAAGFLMIALLSVFSAAQNYSRLKELGRKHMALQKKLEEYQAKMDVYSKANAELFDQMEHLKNPGDEQKMAELNDQIIRNTGEFEDWQKKYDPLFNESLVLEMGKAKAKEIIKESFAKTSAYMNSLKTEATGNDSNVS